MLLEDIDYYGVVENIEILIRKNTIQIKKNKEYTSYYNRGSKSNNTNYGINGSNGRLYD